MKIEIATAVHGCNGHHLDTMLKKNPLPVPSEERAKLQREQDEAFLKGSLPADESYDEHLWLEDIEGDAALAWVRSRNVETEQRLGHIQSTEEYTRILEILDSQHKIPFVQRIGDLLYNFWCSVVRIMTDG